MKTYICALLSVCFVLSATGATAIASQEGKSSSQQVPPLTRAVDEFKVLTRDMGMRPGSPVTAQKNHGPKMLWHGRIYENFRNDVLDAIPHQVRQNGESQSPLRRNQFGFNVAGPVIIPHLLKNSKNTFFTLSYEGVRELVFHASLHTVPTAAQRVGDFSQTVDEAGNLLPIYDPVTTTLNPFYDPSQPVSTSNLQYLRSTFPAEPHPCSAPGADRAASLVPVSPAQYGYRPFLPE